MNDSDTIKKKYNKMFGNQFARKYYTNDIEQMADELWNWFQLNENVWLKDFCIFKMISHQRISEFAKQNEYFRFIYDLCKTLQESKLVKLGLKERAVIPIFALKNICGWKDRQEIATEIEYPEFDVMTDEQLNNYIQSNLRLLNEKN